MTWRVGSKVPLNVYEGDRPVCQCHTPEDAARIVAAMNGIAHIKGRACGEVSMCRMVNPSPIGPLHGAGWNGAISAAIKRLEETL